jgi:adenylate cyclase
MSEAAPSRLERAGRAYIRAIARSFIRGDEPADIRVEKGLLVGATILILPAALLWGSAYLYYGEPAAAAMTYGYLLLSIVGLVHLHRSGHRKLLSAIQVGCTLFVPFLLTLVLGGLVSSSAIIFAAIMSPLGILMHSPYWNAVRWFVAFILLFVLAAFLDPFISGPNGLPQWLILLLFVLNITVLSALIFFMTRIYIQQRNLATALLHEEQAKSEGLLLNVLPASIAAILKEENRTIAERFDSVTVLFADVAGSTPLAEQLGPVEMVDLLNAVFNYFDGVVQKYGLEKVRTMGDSYMIVSGAPTPRADHGPALARAALEMRAFHDHVFAPHAGLLQFRIGMNCGPAVAGIIGRTKFHYDVWGDTVNVASRMESHGLPGKIQITEALHELLGDDFVYESRGEIDVKGKGRMTTWFLEDENKAAT